MTRWIKTGLLAFLFIGMIVQLSACGSGGGDAPFIFGDGDPGSPSGSPDPLPSTCDTDDNCSSSSEKHCKNPPGGQCVECLSDDHCASDQTCDTSTNKCVTSSSPTCTADADCTGGLHCKNPPGQCVDCVSNDQCPDDQVCNASNQCESGSCVPQPCSDGQIFDISSCQCVTSTACQANFFATLALRADSPISDKRDITSACFYYNLEPDDSFNPDPGTFPYNTDPNCDFDSDNTCHRDLFCCANGPIPAKDSDGNILFCDPPEQAIDEQAQGRTLAVTRWQPKPDNTSMKILFQVTDSSCRFQIRSVDFPQYRLQNSGLDAALIIDAGGTAPLSPQLQGLIADGSCSKTPDGGIALETDEKSGLRFRVRFFVNSLKTAADDQPFTTLYDPHEQIMPPLAPADVAQLPLKLRTGPVTALPGKPAASTTPPTEVENLSITGQPIHMEDGKSYLSLVTGVTVLDETNFDKGGGLLASQLGGAAVTAELMGEIRRATDGHPIASLDDLKSVNCGKITTETKGFELSMNVSFPQGVADQRNLIQETPGVDQPYVAGTCVTGAATTAGDCGTPALVSIPFAKDSTKNGTPDSDPPAGLEGRFRRQGTIVILNADVPNAGNVDLAVPPQAGAFKVLNSASLQGTLVPGESTTIEVQFDPETAGSECAVDPANPVGGLVICQSEITISASPMIKLRLKGQAKQPVAEMRLDEIATSSPYGWLKDVFPASPASPIDFEELLIGLQPKPKLFQISNNGVRPLVVNQIQSVDAYHNFRRGSVYLGPSFQERVWGWLPGMQPWTVTPLGNNSHLFFFLNYGPFGRVGAGCEGDASLRCDTGALSIQAASLAPVIIPLTGQAREDRRSILGLFVQDDNRGFVDPEDRLLDPANPASKVYEALSQLFSFRADHSKRDVYLKNNAAPGGNSLVIKKVQTPPDGSGFSWEWADVSAQACGDDDLTACLTIDGGASVKIGAITFDGGGGSYTINSASLAVTAESKTAQGTGVLPIIGGYYDGDTVDRSHVAIEGAPVSFSLKGANNPPDTTGGALYDLRIHRLFAGLDQTFSAAGSNSYIITTSTRGILERGVPGLSDLAARVETFTIPSRMELNAKTGTARLYPIFTAVDSGKKPVEIDGIRLFNGPGSSPQGKEFDIQCEQAPGHDCAYFYLYLGDWSSTTVQCNNKPIIAPSFSGTATDQSADPLVSASCMKSGLIPIDGRYDPVTGAFAFENIAVRLYAPLNPAIGQPIDSTMHLDLTTGCVSGSEAYGMAGSETLIVDRAGDDPLDYDSPPWLPQSPLIPFAGGSCAGTRQLHGRPMISADANGSDPTGTLDNGSLGELAASAFDFDLAGVAKIKSHHPEANGKIMYIVIKAQVGHQCNNGNFVEKESMCP